MAKVTQERTFANLFGHFTQLMVKTYFLKGVYGREENPGKTTTLHSEGWTLCARKGLVNFGSFLGGWAIFFGRVLANFLFFVALSSRTCPSPPRFGKLGKFTRFFAKRPGSRCQKNSVFYPFPASRRLFKFGVRLFIAAFFFGLTYRVSVALKGRFLGALTFTN